MNGRNGPLSPDSVGGGDWSGVPRYQSYDTDPSYSAASRGQLNSPPISRGSTSTMNGGGGAGFPLRNESTGNPSPPASVARSSGAPSMYNQGGENGRGRKDEYQENILGDHYALLKRFLATSLKDDKGNPRPNRARDKLLRLSPVQFQELSTDVFDELQRRQDSSRKGPAGQNGAPAFLLPKDIFHPKRNQARQKLSTLPPLRFRDLATDVFYELERRFPRFPAGDLSRVGSPASSIRGPPSRNGNGTPVNGRGPQRMRRPSDASSLAGYSIRSESRGRNGPINGNGMGNGPSSPGLQPSDYGRPQPKTFQSNTIVPNKSTMVEDDETGDDEDDAFALENPARSRQGQKPSGSETDKKLISDYQFQVSELRGKLDSMEDAFRTKSNELEAVLAANQNKSQSLNSDKAEWAELRIQLESQLADAQTLNSNLQFELEKIKTQHSMMESQVASQVTSERELRAQVAQLTRRDEQGDHELSNENNELKQRLKQQEVLTEEVRRDAQEFLREMRVLSEQTATSFNREEELSEHIVKLEDEVKDWRNRYARTKTQLRSLRASSMGLTIQQDAGKVARDSGFIGEDGLVADVHVTKFQISIDELLRIARENDPTRVIDFMKSVVVSVRRITQDIDEAMPVSEELAQLQAKLKSKVSATANNLITASKNYAAAKGLSPVSLLDAAASHLTTAVVDLVRTVKIKPTPAGELQDDDDGTLMPVDTTGFFKHREVKQEGKQDPKQDLKPTPQPFLGLRTSQISTDSSMYSPVTSPRDSTNIRPRSSGNRSSRRTTMANGHNAEAYTRDLPPMGVGFGIRMEESNVGELKQFLDDQTAHLVQNIQALVSSIRSESGITAIVTKINAISSVVGGVVARTETSMSATGNHELRQKGEPILRSLARCKEQLSVKAAEGKAIADAERDDDEGEREWRSWNQSLPPIAFEIARETKELVGLVDFLDGAGQGDDGAVDEDFS